MGIFVGCLLGFGLLEWLLYRRRERQLKELTLYLLKLQDRLELPAFSSFREGQLGVLQSEIYKLSALLGEQARRAKRENAYLADMMSDISHQIKTPLAAITLMTDLLKEPELSEEKRLEYAEKIDSQTGKITWFTRNLLTLAQMEGDMLKLKKERVRARELLDKACGTLLILAEMREVSLEIEAEEEIWLVCDEAWTAEALGNVIKNCIEHAGGTAKEPDNMSENGIGHTAGREHGRVRVAVTQNNFATNFVITDNGCGIAKEDLPHIFERFYRGRHASKNSVGIGLAMARQIIMQQNGVIQVQSEEGCGTEFRVKLYE